MFVFVKEEQMDHVLIVNLLVLIIININFESLQYIKIISGKYSICNNCKKLFINSETEKNIAMIVINPVL